MKTSENSRTYNVDHHVLEVIGWTFKRSRSSVKDGRLEKVAV